MRKTIIFMLIIAQIYCLNSNNIFVKPEGYIPCKNKFRNSNIPTWRTFNQTHILFIKSEGYIPCKNRFRNSNIPNWSIL